MRKATVDADVESLSHPILARRLINFYAFLKLCFLNYGLTILSASNDLLNNFVSKITKLMVTKPAQSV